MVILVNATKIQFSVITEINTITIVKFNSHFEEIAYF